MLYYMPQTWASDNTDAVSRLKIQYGTSIVYPVSSIGAHVSDVPNHLLGRVTSFEMRGNAAFFGAFGYELDLTKLSEEDAETARKQVSLYKEIRGLVQFGDLYRLLSPFEGNEASWMFVSEDRSEVVVFYFHILAQPNSGVRSIRLQGLEGDQDYELLDSGESFGGDELMSAGLRVPAELTGRDFSSQVWRFRKISPVENGQESVLHRHVKRTGPIR
ncbi:Alpha-galactosidase [compost metagenome]